MTVKLLCLDDYDKYFYFNQPETGCGFEMDRDIGDNYFFIQTFLPKSFFDIIPMDFIANPFVRETDVPENIHVKFELFGIGLAGKTRVFVFKPWIVNVDNLMLLTNLESSLFFIPEKIFFNLVLRLLFLEQFTLPQLHGVRVFEEIQSNDFNQFGLHRTSLPPCYETARFLLKNVVLKNAQKDIENFYAENDCKIEPHLTNKYFRANLNKWYAINGKNNNTIYGYLRIYSTSSSFTGGVFVEYIVNKKVRNKGVATESLKGLLNFLEEYSFAFTVSAEVNEDNEASIRVLKKCNFSRQKSGDILLSDNYNFNLIGKSSTKLESEYYEDNLKFRIDRKYIEKFGRYFT